MRTPGRIAHAAVFSLLATGSIAACGTTGSAGDPSSTSGDSASHAPGGTSKSGAFKAGTFKATGQYPTPGGLQAIGVTITLDTAGKITEASVQPKAQTGNSVQFQGKFASGIAAAVVGKSILDLDVDKVSGSSLTSGGFNRAIEEIVEEAQQ